MQRHQTAEIGALPRGRNRSELNAVRPVKDARRQIDPGEHVHLDHVGWCAPGVARPLNALHGAERRNPDLDGIALGRFGQNLEEVARSRRLGIPAAVLPEGDDLGEGLLPDGAKNSRLWHSSTIDTPPITTSTIDKRTLGTSMLGTSMLDTWPVTTVPAAWAKRDPTHSEVFSCGEQAGDQPATRKGFAGRHRSGEADRANEVFSRGRSVSGEDSPATRNQFVRQPEWGGKQATARNVFVGQPEWGENWPPHEMYSCGRLQTGGNKAATRNL